MLARLGAFVLDGDKEHSELITSILTKDNIVSTLVLLVVDMSRPWGIAESLASWSSLLETTLKRLGADAELAELKKKSLQFGFIANLRISLSCSITEGARTEGLR